MSSYPKEEVAKYRLERAKEALEEAIVLSNIGHWNTTASRLYYTCFYCASAYMIMSGVKASTHAGIKSAFNKELLLTNRLPRVFGQLYNDLFNLRQDADYRDFKDLKEADVRPMIAQTASLLQEMEIMVSDMF